MVPPNEEREQACDEEEDAIHDAKCEAGLEHRARLIRVDVEARDAGAHIAEIDGVGSAGGDM